MKNLLLGLAPTHAEVAAVEADPGALGSLVDGWMQRPEYTKKMLRFLELSLQQTQIKANDLADIVHGQLGMNDSTTPLLLQNVEESFARTVLELDAEGRPFTEVMSTTRVMMTPALKEFYAFLDSVEVDNDANTYDNYRASHLHVQIVAEAAQGPIPLSETLDPNSPNYMHWYDPDVRTALADVPGCQQDPVNLPSQAITLHWLLLGSLDARTQRDGSLCPAFHGTPGAAQLTASDFSAWSIVSLRQPNAGEEPTAFFDLPTLRSGKELVLTMPHVGFFSSPAFFANWPTNVSNQMRVTAQQALIVATGAGIDGSDATVPDRTPGLDAAHSTSGACLRCHQLLDPTRSILAANWSWNYHNQQDASFSSEPGLFAFQGVVQPVKTLADFGAALAGHPLVASGWAQKLCYYVNSAPCSEQDPEFQRVAALFRDTRYSFSALVKAFVTSPLATYASETQSARETGEVIAIARRDHLCAALDARLGLEDVCGLEPASRLTATGSLPDLASGLPADGYGRGVAAPIQPSEPSLFFRAGVENLCETVAGLVIDPVQGQGFMRWTSNDPANAISDFVSLIIGLTPQDPRATPARKLLDSHFQAALARPEISPTDALRSTFVVACLSPSLVSIGL